MNNSMMPRRRNGRQYREGDRIGRFELIHRIADVEKNKDRRWRVRCRKCKRERKSTTDDLFKASEKCRCNSTVKGDWIRRLPRLVERHTVKQIAKKVKRQEGTVRNAISMLRNEGKIPRKRQETDAST